MSTESLKTQTKPADPRGRHEKPPFEEPAQAPGHEHEMENQPDHGEKSYRGSGRLMNTIALITGGDSGIGRAVAIAYAREGAEVAISYLTEEKTDAQGIVRWIKNAARTALELWDRTFRTNVYAMFYLSKAALPRMQSGGAIINTASVQAYHPSGQLLGYAITKGAIVTFTKALADLAIKQGVRVSAVAPGPVWTPLIPSTIPSETVRKFGKNTLIGRPAQPAELAPANVYLATSDSSHVTASVMDLTGGRKLL